MATATTIYLTPAQRKGLFARARKRKTSFSEELRSALDFYLDLPPDFDEAQFAALLKEASASMDRSIAKLDEMIVMVGEASAALREQDRRLDELNQKRL